MRICLAPMDGITDLAYRTICSEIFTQYGHPDDHLMLWTEFMSAEGYLHNPPGVIKHLRTHDAESGLIAQIFGGTTDGLSACAHDIAHKYPSFAGIEINMGCPSPSVMKCDAGSAMLKDKQKTIGILAATAANLSLPLSLKTRIGLTESDKDAQYDFLLDVSHYVWMIIIHGRTYNQSHAGTVDRERINQLKYALPNKVIIGNGGIRSYTDAQAHQGPLDGIMIGQSAIGNPWILTPYTPTIAERFATILRHLDLAMSSEYLFAEAVAIMQEKITFPTYEQLNEQAKRKPRQQHSETTAHIPYSFRKYLFNYISGLEGNKCIKQQIPHRKDYETLYAGIQRFGETLLG